jgi:predicted ATPase
LFTAGEQAAEFQRTVSRLHEMQSVEYLQTERRR